MSVDRVKFQDIVESQLPRYVREEFPLLPEFLKQYYVSQEFESGTLDIVQNIDKYVKLDEITNLSNNTVLRYNIDYVDTTIETSYKGNFTAGFPDNDGLIQIDDEIIYYKTRTDNTFEGCIRGFSGISSYISYDNPEELVFESTSAAEHKVDAKIKNLNVIFLQEFFKKLKKQIAPGFDNRTLDDDIDKRNLIYGLKSFYRTKGTDSSFKILFNALYGKESNVIRPTEFLFRPSDADYRVTEDMVVESLEGNPLDLENQTLYQISTGVKATITKISPINYDKGQFYQVGIDLGYDRDIDVTGTKFAGFKINPKTRLLNQVSAGSTILDVDSAVGFAKTGYLTTIDRDGNSLRLNYTGKSSNQFFGVGGVVGDLSENIEILEDDYSYSYVGIGSDDIVRVRIGCSLNEFIEDDVTNLIQEGDKVFIKSLGIEPTDIRSRGWFTNVKTTLDVQGVDIIDDKEKIYEIITFDTHYYYAGVELLLYNNAGFTSKATITRISSDSSFVVKSQGRVTNFSLGIFYKVEAQLLKTNTRKYPKLKEYVSNIQNTYSKFNGDTLVTSNSLPNLLGKSVDPNDRKYTFSGSAYAGYELKLTNNVDHGFYTGDTVFYERGSKDTVTTTPDGVQIVTQEYSGFDNLDDLVLYVKRVDQETIKLARSKSDIFVNKYVLLAGEVENIKLSYYNYYNKELLGQGIVREVATPNTKSGNYVTQQGEYTGILLDGVEILNYKSTDKIHYGQVRDVDVIDGGDGYDVISPPLVHIEDLTGDLTIPIGTGATGNAAVSGNLKEIRILDSGFDYIEKPFVSITGGAGQYASAEVNTTDIDYSISFNAGVSSSIIGQTGNINTVTNTIGFSTYHKFRDNERVIYDTKSQEGIIGLTTGAFYHVNVVDDYNITLHNTFDDSNSNVNTLQLTDVGRGIHFIQSENKKKIVTNILVTNPGSGYQNKKKLVTVFDGVDVGTDSIQILNHGYESGQIVNFYRIPGQRSITGLNQNKNYYVHKVDDNNFKLSNYGTGGVAIDYYYKRNIYVNLRSRGAGYFNYLPITVKVNGVVGVSTLVGQDFSCKVQPIFRGPIDSVDITEGGEKYGSEEIFNFDRTPVITFKNGEDAKLTPIVNNGKIVDVAINEEGYDYFSTPDLVVVSDQGTGARLVPIIEEGKIIDVLVEYSGYGYVTNKTFVDVRPAGSNHRVKAILDMWNINEQRRQLINVTPSDSFVSQSTDGETLQISHLYVPRELRESLNSLNGDGSQNYGRKDLEKRRNLEKTNYKHSPIVGWAYDGNPIYGPYGFDNGKNGKIAQMESGYKLINIKYASVHRPSSALYPGGFFIEDFTFTNRGDLDVHNGRFCVTPDYPNGTYAYFTTLNQKVSSKGFFKNFKAPKFPYVIGNSFKFNPNQFNLKISSNQQEYDFESNGWFRNTDVYHLNDDRSGYNFIVNSSGIDPQSLKVTGASKGGVTNIGIVTGGNNYKVGDRVIFDNEKTSGKEAKARVSVIDGKPVVDLRTNSYKIDNVEFVTNINPNTFIGFAANPIEFDTRDNVTIDGLSEYVKGFDGQYTVGIRSDSFALSLGVKNNSTTGLTTYFYISGALEYPFIRPNDILTVDNERVKVLNIDRTSSRIRVARRQNATPGSAHPSGSILLEDPRKFTVNIVGLTTTKKLRTNEEYYFIPQESVGLGTDTSVGAGYTVFLSDSGVGSKKRFLTSQSIYIPNHKLVINDELYYNKQGNSAIEFWNGVSGHPINKSLESYDKYYVIPLTSDTIGLSTQRMGYDTNGGYVSASGVGPMFFTNAGNGDYQSFLSNFSDVLKASVSRNLVNVATAKTHGLSKDDYVTLEVKPYDIETVVVTYNQFNKVILFGGSVFDGSDLDLSRNTITIEDHDFIKGDKVVYLSGSPVGGLSNNNLYYVIPYDKDKIQLVRHKFDISSETPDIIDLTSSGNGTFSKINPLVKIKRNQVLKFDLSDSSLSFIRNKVRYSGFEMNLFSDYKYINTYTSSEETREFEVTKRGRPGLDSFAELKLYVSDYVPQTLWYNFELQNLDRLIYNYREYHVDDESISHNQINVELSEYNGRYRIIGVGGTQPGISTSFQFTLGNTPQNTYWSQNNAKIQYTTESQTASGPIVRFNINNPGYDYLSIPGITSVRSDNGDGAILLSEGANIGNILKTEYEADNIGFDYPTDQTMRVVSNVPEVINVSTLASLDYIGIASQGRNYLIAPDLIVLDGYTNKLVKEIDLKYKLGDSSVTIRENTTGLYPVEPRIIATNNSNGVGINSIMYHPSTKTGQAFLKKPVKFIEDFPFNVGDEIFIENTTVLPGETGLRYNSSDYSYSTFKIIDRDPNVGGFNGSITYDMSDFVKDSDVGGKYDVNASIGKIIDKTHLPIFKPTVKKNNLLIGETLIGGGSKGKVMSWNPITEVAKISSRFGFNVNDKLIGQTTGAICYVSDVVNYDSEITTTPGATIVGGWEKTTGFFNNSLQRLPNNEYYQNFSYSIASEISIDDWDDAVSSIAHPAGVQKFSDLQVISVPDVDRNANAVASDVNVKIEITSEASIHSFYDFDYVSERTSFLNDEFISREIYFENRILTDHFECISNRVFLIDDISDKFDSNTRDTVYIDIGQYTLNEKLSRSFAYIKDTTFIDDRQLSIISLIQDGTSSFQNTYGQLITNEQLGYFDWRKNELGWTYRFFPTKPKFNSYEVSMVTINLFDTNQGIGVNNAIGFSSICDFTSQDDVNIPENTPEVVVSYATTYRSGKSRILILGSDSNQEEVVYGVDFTTIHDGSTVKFTKYGDLGSDSGILNEYYLQDGIGVFGANIVGNEVQVTFEPRAGIAVTSTSTTLLTSATEVGIGSFNMKSSKLVTNHINIPASATPIAHSISAYGYPFESAVYYVTTSDNTNNNHEFTEVAVLNNNTSEWITEFASVITGEMNGIGTFGATNDTSNTILTFTPEPNIDVDVRLYGYEIQVFLGNDHPDIQQTDNFDIINTNNQYKGTLLEQQAAFKMKSYGDDIFIRNFRGDLDSIVGVGTNSVILPYHKFEGGERITYNGNEGRIGTSVNRIGIAETSIAGVSTDKLPRDCYVVKFNDAKIGFAASATDALLREPKTFQITSVGLGTFHQIKSQKTDERTMILIDNMIQSPIADSDIYTSATRPIATEIEIRVAGITSFFSDDIIRIDNEYMLVKSSWFDDVEENFYIGVVRGMMGSRLAAHSDGSDIVKVSGQYNIVENTINFIQSPKGKIPLSTTTEGPDETDWTGVTTHSSFQGRTFNRTSFRGVGLNTENYADNNVYDDISSQFTGIRSDFLLKYEGESTAGISTDNAVVMINGVFQHPDGINRNGRDEFPSYTMFDNAGDTNIRFLANEYNGENNTQSFPRGGILMEVGSQPGFGYQPLITAGGVASVSGGGVVTSISISNPGSGYRSGLQNVRVGVQTYSSGVANIHYVGTATITNGVVTGIAITNGGSGYSNSNPPDVVFDDPLPYSNVPLVYSTSSVGYPDGGAGTGAKVDIVVGNGSSVINFELADRGTGYGDRQKLTVAIGGTIGIPTTGSSDFSEFIIDVGKTQRDQFNSWYLGELQVLDDITDEFNGRNKTFNLKLGGEGIAVMSRKGSQVIVRDVLLVFINGVLQEPGRAYGMQGGSVVRFSEAPKEGEKGEIFFYKGTRDLDVRWRDILETIKEGDTVNIDNNPIMGQGIGLDQENRPVVGINTVDSVNTAPYVNPGVTTDTTLLRPITWNRQLVDVVIDGEFVGKDRMMYEPNIFPFSYLIQSVGVTTTIFYVDSVKPLFDALNETIDASYQRKIQVISQDANEPAYIEAVVGPTGVIADMNVTNSGIGYTSNPSITISNPSNGGEKAIVDAIIQNNRIVDVDIVIPGSGYSQDNPPIVLVQPPRYATETLDVNDYSGDYGVIVGFGTNTSGSKTRLVFDFFIPQDSYMRNYDLVDDFTSISGIQTGDFFTVFDSTETHSTGTVVSKEIDNNTRIGISTDSLDNIYQVDHSLTISKNVPGVGTTEVRRVFTNIVGYSVGGISFDNTNIKFDSTVYKMDEQDYIVYSGSVGSSSLFGRYSWGKIDIKGRPDGQSFNFYGGNGYAGLTTSTYVRRYNDLKFKNYEVIDYWNDYNPGLQ